MNSRFILIASLLAFVIGILPLTAHSQDPAPAQPKADEKKFEVGPEGTVKLGNTQCAMMSNKPVHATQGFAHNGWWISICCGMCANRFKRNIDRYAADFKELTGVDVRQAPPRPADADGNVKLGNTTCPVKDVAVDGSKGFAYKGWWISCSNDESAAAFKADVAKFAAKIKERMDVDVNTAPKKPEADAEKK